MRQLTTVLLLVLSISLTAQSYMINAQSSKLEWTGKAAFSTYKLSGTLEAQSGSVVVTDAGVISQGSVVIDMTSLEAEMGDLKKHLRSKDFFHVKKYPEAKFELSEYIESDNCYKGLLSIKEFSKPYSAVLETQVQDNAVILSGTITINRTDYGITFNSPSYFEKLKDQAIADDFKLEIRLVFEKK